jgi:hypothetical protein
MKTLRRLEQESRLNGSTMIAPVSIQSDDAPLDLCTKNTSAGRTDVTGHQPPLPSIGTNPRQPVPMTPTQGPILTVPMCFAAKSSAALPMPRSGAVGAVAGTAGGAMGARIIVPSPCISAPNGPNLSPLPASLPRGPAVNLPIMQLPAGPYQPSASNIAILHPAFQLSPNGMPSPIAAPGSVPLSPATPVIATLSPFIGSPFLMTHLTAAAQQPVPAGLRDGQSVSELRK